MTTQNSFNYCCYCLWALRYKNAEHNVKNFETEQNMKCGPSFSHADVIHIRYYIYRGWAVTRIEYQRGEIIRSPKQKYECVFVTHHPRILSFIFHISLPG